MLSQARSVRGLVRPDELSLAHQNRIPATTAHWSAGPLWSSPILSVEKDNCASGPVSCGGSVRARFTRWLRRKESQHAPAADPDPPRARTCFQSPPALHAAWPWAPGLGSWLCTHVVMALGLGRDLASGFPLPCVDQVAQSGSTSPSQPAPFLYFFIEGLSSWGRLLSSTKGAHGQKKPARDRVCSGGGVHSPRREEDR